jgi:dihydrofolate reductase
VEFLSGDLGLLFQEKLKPVFQNIWVAGGGQVAGEVLRRQIADEVRYSILPVLIGDGLRFFEGLNCDVRLHLLEVKAYRSGIVALRHSVLKA